MALTASQIFDAIAPDYASDPRKTTFLTLARTRTNTCIFGDNTEEAVALRAAHMITLASRGSGGEAGSVSSKREGDLAISYGRNGSTNAVDDLHQTNYGVQLKNLIKGSGGYYGVTGGLDNGCIGLI